MSFSTAGRPRWLRGVALLSALTFAWSFVLATPAQLLAQSVCAAPKPPAGLRRLSATEMGRMRGRVSGPHPTSVSLSSGDTFPWEASADNTNTGNGNKMTSLPLVSWTARGGMPVHFTLIHTSESTHNAEAGQKWTHSYDIYLVAASGSGGLGLTGSTNLSVHWGDDLSYTFTQIVDGSFSPPTGIHDLLVKNADNTYTLTTPDQTQYHFRTNLYCDTIGDENGNTVSPAYNANNYVTTVTDPTNRTLTLAYDANNRIHTLTDPLNRQWTLAYDASGNLASVSLPALNGQTYQTVLTYNATHDITDLQSPAGRHSVFTYNSDDSLATEQDGAGNVSTRTDTDGTVTTFGYDPSDQITSESRDNTHGTGYSIAYTYDHNQNRKTKVQGGVTDTYSYDSHDKLTSTSSKSYGYDLNGNCTSVTVGSNTTTLTYDDANRVTGITYPSTATNSFTYNGLGLRVGKTDSAATFAYVCDGTEPASAVLKDGQATYTPGLSERRGSTSKFQHADALGSTRGITDSTQATTDSMLYDAFGMTVSRTGSTPTPFGFVGQGQYKDRGLLLENRYKGCFIMRSRRLNCATGMIGASVVFGICMVGLATYVLRTSDEQVDLLFGAMNDNPRLVIQYLNRGVNPNISDERDRTPIMWMAKFGHKEAVMQLIRHGAQVNLKDTHGSTPIMWARTNGYRGNEEIVRILRQAGEKE